MLLLAREAQKANGRGRVRILSNDNFHGWEMSSADSVSIWDKVLNKERPIVGIDEEFLKDVRWKFSVKEGSEVRLYPEGCS